MNNKTAPPDRRSVPADSRLRHLLRAGRRASGRLSQKTAAQRAGISPVYWQKIESGTQQAAPAATLAAMCAAAGITASQLRDEGYAEIASAADELSRAGSRAGDARGAPGRDPGRDPGGDQLPASRLAGAEGQAHSRPVRPVTGLAGNP